MKTPINMKTIREHMHYSWWKYALIVVAAFVGWNLFYTMTAYRPPQEKEVELFIMGYGLQEPLDAYMNEVWQAEMPDMEAVGGLYLTYDETYSSMQLMTYIAAGEGDLYMLPKDFFNSYAGEGAFVELDFIPGLIENLESAGIDLSKGWRTNIETKEKHLYGIPMIDFPGLERFMYPDQELYLSIVVTNGNDENVAKFLQLFTEDMLSTPTDLAPAQ